MRCSLLPEQRIFTLKCLNLCLCLLKLFCERHRLLGLGMVRRLRRRLLISHYRRRYPATVALLSQHCKSIDLKISWNDWAFPRYVSRCLSLTLDCHQYRIDAIRPYRGRTRVQTVSCAQNITNTAHHDKQQLLKLLTPLQNGRRRELVHERLDLLCPNKIFRGR